MKSVMLIGGGVQEVRAVEFARRLGYRTVVTDRSAHAPCVDLADASYVVDGGDTAGLVALARDLRARDALDGVFTLTELVESVAAVAETADLPGASVRSAELCQDKGLAKMAWLDQSVETPAGGVAHSSGEAQALLERVGATSVIKPVTGFGAIGVRRVEAADDIERYFEDAATGTSSAWVVEEYLTGASHDVNGLFDSAGNFHTQGIADRRFVPGTFAEHEVHAPTVLTQDRQAALYDLLRRAAAALGISSGPVKGDAILTEDGFKMLEIAPRLHGPKMSLYALPDSGQDHWAGFFSVITGGPIVGMADRPKRFFQSRSIPADPGTIQSVEGADEVRTWDGIVEVMLFRGPGDQVRATQNSTDVVGYVLAATESREETAALLERALETLDVSVG